ncbi:MAG: nucleotidyltransferase family protein [Treponema sp.]|jgi:molybdenum cofactor cytidylyltransferase|nr:nucleotidyltransferase family protein [Treponema sp.]
MKITGFLQKNSRFLRHREAVFAILMASGFSRRFGSENKLLVPFRGKALARHTLDLVCGMDCFRKIIFVAADERTAALAEALPLTLVRNTAPEKGQRESIRLGLEAAGAASSSCYLFFPCDQPLLDAAIVRLILEARRPGCIVQPCYRGEPGSPALFSGAFRRELLTLGEGERGRDVIRRHPESLVRVEIAETSFSRSSPCSPLIDVDDPGTLSRLEGLNLTRGV